MYGMAKQMPKLGKVIQHIICVNYTYVHHTGAHAYTC